MSPTTSSIGSPSSVFSINRPIIHQDSGDNGRLKLGPVKTRNKSSRPTFDQRFRSSSWHFFTKFLNMNLRIFSTRYYVTFVLIFSNPQNWEKTAFFWPIKEFVFFFNWKILVKEFVDLYVFEKFVKTCHELNKRCKSSRHNLQKGQFELFEKWLENQPDTKFKKNCDAKH